MGQDSEVAALVRDLQEALAWCGGSVDFAREGQAHKGWKTVVKPALDRAQNWLTTQNGQTNSVETMIVDAARAMRECGQSGKMVRVDEKTEANLTLHYSRDRR